MYIRRPMTRETTVVGDRTEGRPPRLLPLLPSGPDGVSNSKSPSPGHRQRPLPAETPGMLNVTVHQYQIIPDYVKTHGSDLLIPQLRAPNDCRCDRRKRGSNLLVGRASCPSLPIDKLEAFNILDCFVISLLVMTGTHASPRATDRIPELVVPACHLNPRSQAAPFVPSNRKRFPERIPLSSSSEKLRRSFRFSLAGTPNG